MINVSIDSTIYQCGPGGPLRLLLDFHAKSIVREDDETGINLHDRQWEYGFTEDGLLRLRFAPKDQSLVLLGYAAQVDENDKMISGLPVLELRQLEAVLVHVCDRPTAGERPRIMIWFVERVDESSTGLLPAEPSRPKPILPPTQAQPKVILKPRRNCPTVGSSGGPTGREWE